MQSVMTQTSYAEHRGVSRRWISKLIKQGKIPESALFRKGKRTLIIAEEADAALSQNLDPAKKKWTEREQIEIPRAEKDEVIDVADLGEFTFAQAQLLDKKYSAALKKLELEIRQRKYVPLEDVNKFLIDAGVKIRDSVLAIPGRISSILASESKEENIFQILNEEFHKLLEELHQKF